MGLVQGVKRIHIILESVLNVFHIVIRWYSSVLGCPIPKENAYFGPEELQITLKGRPTRVNYSSAPGVLPSHFKSIN